jgi:hypothetical protein
MPVFGMEWIDCKSGEDIPAILKPVENVEENDPATTSTEQFDTVANIPGNYKFAVPPVSAPSPVQIPSADQRSIVLLVSQEYRATIAHILIK